MRDPIIGASRLVLCLNVSLALHALVVLAPRVTACERPATTADAPTVRVEPASPIEPPSEPPLVEPPPSEPPLVEPPPSEPPPVEAPPIESPPSEPPPSEAPPIEAPPSESPPSESPLVDAPPIEAPPIEAPPIEPPPVRVEAAAPGAAGGSRPAERAPFRPSPGEPSDGPVPAVLFTNDDEAEWLELIAAFGLLPIAYDRTDPSWFVTLDLARGALVRSRDFATIQRAYATRSGLLLQPERLPRLAALSREASRRFSIAPRDLVVQCLLPRPFAADLGSRALAACRRAGQDPARVKACVGRLVRDGGAWAWRVEALWLDDGRRLAAPP